MLARAMQSRPNLENHPWFTIRGVANRLGVSRDTVERWIHGGHLRAVDVSTGTESGAQRVSWRIDPQSLEMFLEKRANRPPLPKKAPSRRNRTDVVEFIK